MTVSGANTSPQEYMTVSVYDSNNKLIKSSSGYGTVTVDLSDLSITDRDGCWVSVYHSRSRNEEHCSVISSSWWNYPSTFALDVKSTIKSITVSY